MMVTVYVDWERHEILTEEQFEEEVDGLVQNIKSDSREYDGRLYMFLDEKRIDAVDLFYMTEADKVALREEYEEWLVKDSKAQLLDGEFEKVELNL